MLQNSKWGDSAVVETNEIHENWWNISRVKEQLAGNGISD